MGGTQFVKYVWRNGYDDEGNVWKDAGKISWEVCKDVWNDVEYGTREDISNDV